MQSTKKTVLSMLLVLLVLTPIFSTTKLASTDDGTIFLLKDDNTYEKFVPETYDQDMGYEASDKDTLAFLDQSWDEAKLTALGNYLPSRGYNLGSYTDGEYLLLELESEIQSNDRVRISDHKIPSLKLDDGTILEGSNERIQTTASSSTKSYYKIPSSPFSYSKTLTYSVLYNVPDGKTPVALVFSDSDDNSTSVKLSSYKSL